MAYYVQTMWCIVLLYKINKIPDEQNRFNYKVRTRHVY